MRKKDFIKLLESQVLQNLSETSPPGMKHAVERAKEEIKKDHPDWDEEKVAKVAFGHAWNIYNKKENVIPEDDRPTLLAPAQPPKIAPKSSIDKSAPVTFRRDRAVKSVDERLDALKALNKALGRSRHPNSLSLLEQIDGLLEKFVNQVTNAVTKGELT